MTHPGVPAGQRPGPGWGLSQGQPGRGGGRELGQALGALHQPPCLQPLQHSSAEPTASAELTQGHGPALELQMGQQIELAGSEGLLRPGRGRAPHPPDWPGPVAGSKAALAQPAWGEGTLKSLEEAGVAGGGHSGDQILPLVIHCGPLPHRQDRLHVFAAQAGRQLVHGFHHQAGMGTPLQPNPHQITNPSGVLRRIRVGEDPAFPAGLQPDLEPGRRCACKGHGRFLV